eukprot:snap_masked-scaffold_4-processed-gene-6.25-mRNA-1 protein AED:1.00 eAED:1.00 QI:0/-1/0/0/-1/1/1/0/68
MTEFELSRIRWWTRWKCVKMHLKLSSRERLNEDHLVHDWNDIEHMRSRMNIVIKKLKGEAIEKGFILK